MVDARLRAELDFCFDKGLSHSHFLGGPPVWTELDQDKAVAWQEFHAEICSSCGTRDAEWRDEEGREIDPPPYAVEDVRCGGCQTIAMAEKHITSGDKFDPAGVKFRLVPYSSAMHVRTE